MAGYLVNGIQESNQISTTTLAKTTNNWSLKIAFDCVTTNGLKSKKQSNFVLRHKVKI